MKTIHCTPISPGIAIGQVQRLLQEKIPVPEYSVSNTKREKKRLEISFQQAKEKIKSLIQHALKNELKEEEEILKAFAGILEDPELLELAVSLINTENTNAEFCIYKAAEHYAVIIEAVEDEYIKARAKDVREVALLLIETLSDGKAKVKIKLKTPVFIVAPTITVNELVKLDKKLILGLVTEQNGHNDHTAILARSYGIPFISGLHNLMELIQPNDTLIVDGNKGKVIVRPTKIYCKNYGLLKDEWEQFNREAFGNSALDAYTRDGKRIKVYANVSDMESVDCAIKNGAEGIGLLRSEFLFLNRAILPDEDEQTQFYSAVSHLCNNIELVIRTLDIGADKKHSHLNLAHEENPALGLRGLRLCFQQEEDLFKPQIKAILRAAKGRKIRLMLPMVTTVEEVIKFKALIKTCRKELNREGKLYAIRIQIGIMIEVPAAAILADVLAAEADFFSIGTNDLTQYTLAADRCNTAVAYLNQGLHPSVLQLAKQSIEAAHKKSKQVAVCGELAADPKSIPIFIGLGVDELSVNPSAIPIVKEIIRNINYSDAKSMVREAAKQVTGSDSEALFVNLLPKILR